MWSKLFEISHSYAVIVLIKIIIITITNYKSNVTSYKHKNDNQSYNKKQYIIW